MAHLLDWTRWSILPVEAVRRKLPVLSQTITPTAEYVLI
jgi:hypothetical protein